jgi:hypothetical protein
MGGSFIEFKCTVKNFASLQYANFLMLPAIVQPIAHGGEPQKGSPPKWAKFVVFSCLVFL